MTDEQAGPRIHLVIGAAVIALGVILMLGQLGVIPFSHLYRFWPLILIFAGVVKLLLGGSVLNARQDAAPQEGGAGKLLTQPAHDWLVGVVLIIVGVNFQLALLGHKHFSWNYLWPLLVILGGVAIVYWSLEAPRGPGVWSNAEINQLNFCGGSELRVASQDFRGGRIMSVLGGFKLDLIGASFEGPEAVIYVLTFLGGGEIIVPGNWNVSFRGTSFFGGCNDETRRNPREPGPRKKTLVIKGAWIFGGLNVKN